MRCTARISIPASDPATLAAALEPDNKQAPSYIRVSCSPRGSHLVCEVEVLGCENPRRIMTLRNTLDEIITLARTVEESLAALEGKQ